jgi:ADP-ribosylglycohydrolase
MMTDRRDRFRGALAGLAAGDALGTTLEFTSPGGFSPLKDMVGGGPFRLKPGQWTDDTSMALCLAESLAACGDFEPKDQMQRYVRWWKEGYLSCTGTCFDIGSTVRAALVRFAQSGEPYSGSIDPRSAGNGSLMRLVPVAMRHAASPETAIARAGDSSRTTHGAAEAVDACRCFAGLLVGALNGADKETLLSSMYCPVPGLWEREPLAPRIAAIAAGSFREKQPPEIRGTGYVVDALEAALWAFHGTGNFRDACLAAANLGQDADTTAAICGQIAGAFYGYAAIPASWREQLAMHDRIVELADLLHDRARMDG